MTVIYLDVLVLLNFYVTFFLIKASCCAIHKKPGNGRIFAGSLLGGLSSLVILLPSFHPAITFIIKLAAGIIVVLSVFGFHSCREFLKNTVIFLIINFLFAGLMLALWLFSAPLGMVYNNGFAYFDISLFTIIISTAIAYGLLRLVRYFLDSKTEYDSQYIVEITSQGKTIALNAIADSGNSLTDFFTGLPVIICDYSKTEQIAPDEIQQWFSKQDISLTSVKGLRIIPFSTISGSGTVIAFRPEKVNILCDGKRHYTDALIGFVTDNAQSHEAIFNPKILI